MDEELLIPLDDSGEYLLSPDDRLSQPNHILDEVSTPLDSGYVDSIADTRCQEVQGDEGEIVMLCTQQNFMFNKAFQAVCVHCHTPRKRWNNTVPPRPYVPPPRPYVPPPRPYVAPPRPYVAPPGPYYARPPPPDWFSVPAPIFPPRHPYGW